MYKAILIDSHNQKVVEVETDGSVDALNALIKSDIYTSGFRLPKGHDMCLVDDEGLINGTQVFFHYDGYPHPLAGNGLILGGTSNGETANVKSKVEDVRAKVKFLGLEQVREQLE